MFLCNGTVEYGADKKIPALGDSSYHNLRTAVTSAHRKGLPEDRAQFGVDKHYFYSETIMDDMEVAAWEAAAIDVTCKNVRGLSRGHASPAGLATHITQISLANVGLLEVNEVTYEEDCCTDKLQDMLDAKWRILCVCPPKDSRRPTYVLGRSDPARGR